MIEVETPSGIIEFPDEYSGDQINDALNKHFGKVPDTEALLEAPRDIVGGSAPQTQPILPPQAPQPPPDLSTPQALAAWSLSQGISIPSKVAQLYNAGAGAQRQMLTEQAQQERDAALPTRLYGGEPALPEQTPEVLGQGIQYGRQKFGEFLDSLADFRSDVLRTTGIDPSAMPGRNIFDITKQGLVPGGQPGVTPQFPIGISPLELLPEGRELKQGVETGLGKFGSGLISQPELLALGGAKPVQALFGAEALAAVPESIKALYQARNPQEFGEAGAGAAANLLMGGAIGHHLLTGKGGPYARSIEEAAKVHGDLLSQSEQGARQVPAQEGLGGVQSQTEGGLAEAGKVPLKLNDPDEILIPHETNLLQSIAGALGFKGEINVVPDMEGDPNHKVIAQSGFAEVDKEGNYVGPGRVDLNAAAFRQYVSALEPGQLHQAVGSVLSEEILHSFTTKAEAEAYGKTLTPAERAISQKLYLGPNAPEDVPGGWTDARAGSEAARQRMQRMLQMNPTEIAEVARTQRWSRASLELIARVIRRAREFFGTAAAQEGQGITVRILDRMEQNVDAASQAIGEEAPFAIIRGGGQGVPGPTLDEDTMRRMQENNGASVDTELPGGMRGKVQIKGNKVWVTVEQPKPGQMYREIATAYLHVDPQGKTTINGTTRGRAIDAAAEELLIKTLKGEKTADVTAPRQYQDLSLPPRDIEKERRVDQNAIEQANKITEARAYKLTGRAMESDAAKQFHQEFADPNVRITNAHTAKAGMGLTSISDLNSMLDLLKEERGKTQAALDEAQRTGDVSKLTGGRAQFPREVIETATKTGGWEKDIPELGVQGQRPLQWDQYPVVAKWIRQHANEIWTNPEAIRELPDALKPEEGQAALRRVAVDIDKMSQSEDEYDRAAAGKWNLLPPDLQQKVIALNDYEAEQEKRVGRFEQGRGSDYKQFGAKAAVARRENAIAKEIDQYAPGFTLTARAIAAGNGRFERYLRSPEEGQAAIRRTKAKEEGPELPGMTPTKGKGVLTRPETVPATERTLPEMQKEEATPYNVERAAYQHVAQAAEDAVVDPSAKPISFDRFADAMRVKFGPIPDANLASTFESSTWNMLMNASGEKLAAIRDSLNLRKALGGRDVSNPPSRGEGLLKTQAATGEARAQIRDERKAQAAGQKYRANVISAVARKLFEDMQQSAPPVSRTEVTPFDLWKDRDRAGNVKGKEPKQPIYNELSPEDRNLDPKTLGRMLTQDARPSSTQKVSRTNRITVLQNLDSGKVDVVSTYRDPRRGAVLLDPQHPGQEHAPLESILKRYRPVASVLLNDPVEKFRQSYDSLADYEHRFGRDAKAAGETRMGDMPLGEGEEALPSAYDANAPVTTSEAEAIIPHIEDEVGKIDSPESVKASLDSLSERLIQQTKALKRGYKTGVLPEPEGEGLGTRKAVSAYLKIATALSEKFPDASVQEILDRLATNIYEAHNSASSYQDFLGKIMAQGSTEAGEAVPTRPLSPSVPKGIESVVPKIEVEPRTIPEGRAGVALPKGAPPETMLRPEDLPHVEKLAQEEHPPLPSKYESIVKYHTEEEAAKAAQPTRAYTDAELEGESQASLNRLKEEADRGWADAIGKIRAGFARFGTKIDLSAEKDRSITQSVNASQTTKRNIQQPSSGKGRLKNGDPAVLAAARAINASYVNGVPDIMRLDDFLADLGDAQAKAAAIIANPTPATLSALGLGDIKGVSKGQILAIGRAWRDSAQALEKEVQYAKDHFGEAPLMNTTTRLRSELKHQLNWERRRGRNTKEAENYLPGLYEGEIYSDNGVTFASQVLGKSFGLPKKFANQYEASKTGPFIPKMNDVADIAAHRVRSGRNSVLTDEAFKSTASMVDPVTQTPISIPTVVGPNGVHQVPPGMQQYELVSPGPGKVPLAVRKGYSRLMKNLFERTGLEDAPGGRAIIALGAIAKHTALAMDFYHLSKMMYFATATMRAQTGFRGGLTALEYRPNNMAEAVRRGVITQKAMDWALGTETVMDNGVPKVKTRQEISRLLQAKGLNVGRVQDAMYKHFLERLGQNVAGPIGSPIRFAGKYNRFLFDQFTRGLMNQAAVMEFIRLNKSAPGMEAGELAGRVARDVNTLFGSPGKQALLKNPTLVDLSQLIFLAPQWTGTRISSEARFLKRAVTVPYEAAKAFKNAPGQTVQGPGNTTFTTGPSMRARLGAGFDAANLEAGTIGRTVGTGLLSMFALTQALNVAFRHQLTFQNQEPEHKLDAWIPDMHGGPGHWVSPLSVFMEITHDVSRLMAGGQKNLAEVISQIGYNKLHLFGRAALAAGTGFTPTGQKITTVGGRLLEAAKAATPVPITFGALGREAAHAVAPKLVSPNPLGALQRQLAGSLGVKTELGRTASSQIAQKADEFLTKYGLKKESGWMQVQVAELPNYTKLRSALRNGDDKEAGKIFDALRKTHPLKATTTGGEKDPIVEAMTNYADKTFTSAENEDFFLSRLKPQELSLYFRAKAEKQAELARFMQFYWKHQAEKR